MNRMLYGIIGPIGHGKTSVAKHLVNKHRFITGSFAGKLKEVAAEIYVPLGAEHRHFFGTQEDKAEPIAALGTTGRRILEVLGTEGARGAYPDTWVRYALEVTYATECKWDRLVFDDVRFPNEAKAIRRAGGEIIRVTASGKPIPPPKHESDTYWRDMLAEHSIRVGVGEMDKLYAAVDGLLPPVS